MKIFLRTSIYFMVAALFFAACHNEIYDVNTSFNAGWKFHKGEAEGAEKPSFDDSQWRSLDLPHDWAIEGPFDVKYNARCGGLPFHGTGWYRKTFNIPDEAKGNVIDVIFDGAMYNAHVWINGHFLGNRPYGYVAFKFDISDYVNYGGENVIAVRLQPEDLSSRWYPGAGLYRNTWIEINEPMHLVRWGIAVKTKSIDVEKARITVDSHVRNKTLSIYSINLTHEVYDPSGKLVATATEKLKALTGGNKDYVTPIEVPDPQLWSPEDPNMYKLVTKVQTKKGVRDTRVSYFGIRTIEVSRKKGFRINGHPYRFNGVCLHHDNGPLGAALNVRAMERKLQIMKDMGVNAIRTSHNPPSPEFLDLCDRMGLMVQVEAFDVWRKPKVENGYNKYFDDWSEFDIKSMVWQNRNHPSVVMWSIGNEILEQADKQNGWKEAKRLADICRKEDDSRPTTAGFNNYPAPFVNKLAQQVDLVGQNYKPTKYREVLDKYPNMIVYGSETSSCTSSRGVYHLPIEKYQTHESKQVSSYDLIGPPWAYPPDVEFDAQEKNPEVLGEFIWTGFDYLGEPTPYGGKDNSTNGYWNADWPARSSYFGAVDLCGFPKDRFYLYQSQWTKKPMVHVLPHWNWEGMEGQTIPVYAYTNCQEVELFVNGKSFGKKVKGVDSTELIVKFLRYEGETFMSKYRLSWDVPYHAGSIKVVGYNNGERVVSQTIKTAGKPSQFALLPDRGRIKADGKDLSYITVNIEDRKGNLCPNATNNVKFTVTGAGELAAVGNGNAATTASFQANNRDAFSGKCMLIVRSKKGIKGDINIVADSEGLGVKTITIKSE